MIKKNPLDKVHPNCILRKIQRMFRENHDDLKEIFRVNS